jgi:site-specific DNA-methyltransferase (adenine-specific)
MIELINGNCLEVMKTIPDNSIDAIITDPPYGTTACKWDSVIDFELMWEQLNRIIKPNGAIVLFGSEPFSSALRMSNIKNYKYDWIWSKNKCSNYLHAKRMPLKYHENISVFIKKYGTYNQQKVLRTESSINRLKHKHRISYGDENRSEIFNPNNSYEYESKDKTHSAPKSIIIFKKDKGGFHPTQKPIALMEHLIKTYTNENETVLDFTMGSGSTMVACVNTNRNGIGIEMDDNYFKIAEQRIKETEYKLF